jgi:hypothetical protein
MADLRVSYSTLDGVHHALESATKTFDGASMPEDGGAFGADDVAAAFVRAAQQRSAAWLVDTSRTLGQYAHDTKSLVQDADDDLAGKTGGRG